MSITKPQTDLDGVIARTEIVEYLRQTWSDESIRAYLAHRSIDQYDRPDRQGERDGVSGAEFLDRVPLSSWHQGMTLWHVSEPAEKHAWVTHVRDEHGVPAWLARVLNGGGEGTVRREVDSPAPAGLMVQIPGADWVALGREHEGVEVSSPWEPPTVKAIEQAWELLPEQSRVMEVHITPHLQTPGLWGIEVGLLAASGVYVDTAQRVSALLGKEDAGEAGMIFPAVVHALTYDGAAPLSSWVLFW